MFADTAFLLGEAESWVDNHKQHGKLSSVGIYAILMSSGSKDSALIELPVKDRD